MQLAAEAVAAGDIRAITPYLKVLDRLDRYQTVAVAHQGYDEEDRRKLMEKINRVAANLGVDETWNAAREYLKKHGRFPADPDALSEAGAIEGLGEGGTEAPEGLAGGGEERRRGRARRPTGCRLRIGAQPERRAKRFRFFLFFSHNSLKTPIRPNKTKQIQRFSPWFSLHSPCTQLAARLHPGRRQGGRDIDPGERPIVWKPSMGSDASSTVRSWAWIGVRGKAAKPASVSPRMVERDAARGA